MQGNERNYKPHFAITAYNINKSMTSLKNIGRNTPNNITLSNTTHKNDLLFLFFQRKTLKTYVVIVRCSILMWQISMMSI